MDGVIIGIVGQTQMLNWVALAGQRGHVHLAEYIEPVSEFFEAPITPRPDRQPLRGSHIKHSRRFLLILHRRKHVPHAG